MILKNLSPSKIFFKMVHDVIFQIHVYSRFSSSEIYGRNVFYWLDMMV